MSVLNQALPTPAPGPRAASLGRTFSAYVRILWDALERQGQRRAAVELARQGRLMAEQNPEASAHLLEQARLWQGR